MTPVEEELPNRSTQLESQQSEMNLITLERNSFNFLEHVFPGSDVMQTYFPRRYTRMQQNTLPNITEGLSFDTVVPKDTSTRHVAASAFYHCLGKSP